MFSPRLGDILVSMGLINSEQLSVLLDEQERTARPLGELAERLFGVPSRQIERAWAEQYAQQTRLVDPRSEHVDPAALSLVSRRQAWQFRLLPLRHEGSELLVATTREHLVRALNFSSGNIPATCFFVMAEAEPLGEALMRHYPMDGMTRDMVAGHGPGSRRAGLAA